MNISDRTFLVTGAGSGLGRATALHLAREGARIVAADIAEENGQQTVDEIGLAARFVRVDVRDESDVAAAIGVAVESFGGLNGVVNCAGVVLGRKTYGSRGPHDLESFERVIAINLVGTFNVVRLAAAAMAESEAGEDGEHGVVVNTASVAAFDGQIGQAAYSASKGGIAGMTLPLARDLASRGIRVVAIAPGIMETPMMAGMPDDVRSSLGAQVPFPSRLGDPDEFAALVGHIIQNRYLNGEVIRLDGAIRMAPR